MSKQSELGDLIRREVVKAQYGTVGELSNGLLGTITDWHNKQIEKLLLSFASKTDAEHTRSEIDNWTFSLGAIVHEAVIEAERKRLKESK